MGTGTPSVLSHPVPRPPAKGHFEAPVTLLAVMVAELTSNESGVDSRKDHDYKETDSLSREKKERWWREKEGETRQAKQLQKYYKVYPCSTQFTALSPSQSSHTDNTPFPFTLWQRNSAHLPLTGETRHHSQMKWLKCTQQDQSKSRE